MRWLRAFAAPAGAILLVVALVLGTFVANPWVPRAIGGAGAVLLVAGIAADRARWSAAMRGRRAREASASAGYVLTVLAVVVLINILATRHRKQIDTTENKEFSLSEQTVKVLDALPRDVSITAFFREGEPTRQKLQDLLDQYRYHSRRLIVTFIDPDSHPGDAKRYGVTEDGTIIIESGKQESRTNTPEEEAVTNAIIKVTRDRERIVYVTVGHGEHSLDDQARTGLTLLKGELEKQHYTVKPLSLNQGVPADASLVIVAGPQKPLLEAEVKRIGDYLDGGGRVLDMQDPDTDPGLQGVLDRYGVEVHKDLVIDRVSQLLGGDVRIPMIPGNRYDASHPITKTFRYQTFYPLACSLAIKPSLPEGVSATALGTTEQFSWGETSQEQLRSGRVSLDDKDIKGPLTLAVAVTRKLPAPAAPASNPDGEDHKPPAPEARLVVFGDSDFVTNSFFNDEGNGDLALNVVAWLAEQEELVSIRPKSAFPRIVILTRSEMFFYLWTLVLLAPAAVTVTGVAIWWRRKKL